MSQIENRLERPELMAKQIIKLYNQANEIERTEGATWYTTANQICRVMADKFTCPLTKVVGVVSALSPATNWFQNIADSHNLISAWSKGIDPDQVVVTTYGANKRKAISILNANMQTGSNIAGLLCTGNINKTVSFFWNILNPKDDSFVTVDRHAIRIALGSRKADGIGITEKRYRTVVKSYQVAANKLHLNAIDLQAIVWVAYRRINGVSASKLNNEVYNSVINQIKG